MVPQRRLKLLSSAQLLRLTAPRLLAYRDKALSLENRPEASDFSPEEIRLLDGNYIWFKADPRWRLAYGQILAALVQAQSHA